MDPNQLYQRYQELQAYVGWTEEDGRRVQAAADLLEPHVPPLIDDFYEEIKRHPQALKVITGGEAQIERLKGTLRTWVRKLLNGPYDREFVVRRWQVGWRHVDIGLDQVFTNVAMSRLRRGLLRALAESWPGDIKDLLAVRGSLNVLLDLDLAIIEDAYQTEYLSRQQRSERLAAIGQVAGGVAHELRNPLNVVKTSVYFLVNSRNASPEKVAEHLRRIERQVTLADTVITALTNFAKMPVPNLLPFPIHQCIAEALEINLVPSTIQVQVECPDSLPAALGDIDQLRIVFGNLLRNAREAMAEAGKLHITARRVDQDLEVDVADTGHGIPPDELSRIMEPLFTTKARGLGLGLAIARAILEKNRGSLRVGSEAGQGTTFTVRLPAVP